MSSGDMHQLIAGDTYDVPEEYNSPHAGHTITVIRVEHVAADHVSDDPEQYGANKYHVHCECNTDWTFYE